MTASTPETPSGASHAAQKCELPPGIWVVDNFTPWPDAARASALAAGFGTWRPPKGEVGSSVYEGMGFQGDHAMLMGPSASKNGVLCRSTCLIGRALHQHHPPRDIPGREDVRL